MIVCFHGHRITTLPQHALDQRGLFVVYWLSMLNYQPLQEAHQKRLVAIVAAKGGKSQAARLLGCSRLTIKAAMAGQPVHPYTAESLAKKIAERDAAGKSP
jgi:hypothetical protein